MSKTFVKKTVDTLYQLEKNLEEVYSKIVSFPPDIGRPYILRVAYFGRLIRRVNELYAEKRYEQALHLERWVHEALGRFKLQVKELGVIYSEILHTLQTISLDKMVAGLQPDVLIFYEDLGRIVSELQQGVAALVARELGAVGDFEYEAMLKRYTQFAVLVRRAQAELVVLHKRSESHAEDPFFVRFFKRIAKV